MTINANRAWAWVDFTFPSPVSIQAGTIWIGYIAGGSKADLIQMRYTRSPVTFAATQLVHERADEHIRHGDDGNFHYSIYAIYG